MYAVHCFAGMTINGNSKHAYTIFNKDGIKVDVMLTKNSFEVRTKYPDILIFHHNFEIKSSEWKFLKGFKKVK